tara:strand:- start:767 stop:898 length:132 start_codon:yes stop_codon:yes gene_type:complete
MFYDLGNKKVKNVGENCSASSVSITENAIHYQKNWKKYSESIF